MTVTEMAGFYQLQCEPVREMLRRYLTGRAIGAGLADAETPAHPARRAGHRGLEAWARAPGAVREAGPGAPAGKAIAELMLGFWRYLSTAARRRPL